ncbi:MAG: YbfB/YjiJ family MFS transporter [Methylocella sp.]
MRNREVSISVWQMAGSGLCASLVGIGLSRCVYTPLLKEPIARRWFTPPAAAYLGAVNLIGHLAGALLARPIAVRTAAVPALRAPPP